ncbi:hypothetical protein B0G76_0636 [Paraburkholderia sp. BL23I1N1]|nr:hypothetical protein B0G76_0636 [Paraburkholderia sp. BL23I1N1]
MKFAATGAFRFERRPLEIILAGQASAWNGLSQPSDQ